MTDITLTKNSIVKLKSSAAIRYEHNLNEGTMIIIDTENEKVWFGNSETKNFINELKYKTYDSTLGQIYSKIISEYEDFQKNDVIESLNSITADLYSKGFLEIINI